MEDEIFTLIKTEVSEAIPVMDAILAEWFKASNETAADCMERYTEQTQRIDKVMQMLELDGLQEICIQVETNSMTLADQPLDSSIKQLFEKWPHLLIDYLNDPAQSDVIENLIIHFQAEEWPIPLDDDMAYQLISQLAYFNPDSSLTQGPIRIRIAILEETSLAIDPAVAYELMESFYKEGPINAINFLKLMHQLAENEQDIPLLEEAYPLVHTLKGIANTVGVRGIANIAIHLEDIIRYCIDTKIIPRNDFKRYLIDAASCFDQMFEFLAENETAAPESSLIIFQHTLDWANLTDSKSFPENGIKPKETLYQEISETIIEPIENIDDDETSIHSEGKTLELLSVIKSELQSMHKAMESALLAWLNSKDENAIDDAINNYTEQLNRLSKVSEMMELNGLHSFTEHLESNLMLAQGLPLIEPLNTLLRSWPEKIENYLSTPNPQNITDIIVFLNDETWELALSEQEISQIKSDLAQISLQKDEPPQTTAEKSPPTTEKPIDTEIIDLYQIIASEFTVINDGLDSALENWQAALSEEAIDQAIATYTEQTLRLNNVSAMELNGLISISEHLEANLLTLQGEPLNTDLLSLLKQWPSALLIYLQTPNNEHISNLAQIFSSPVWNMPLDASEIGHLQTALGFNPNEPLNDLTPPPQFSMEQPLTTAKTVENVITAETIDLYQVILEEFKTIKDDLSKTLDVWLKASSDDAIEEAIEAYNEQSARLANVAKAMELEGLILITENIESNLLALSGQPLTPEINKTLQTWPNLLIDYLYSPKNRQAIEPLLAFFADDQWLLPFAGDEIEQLRQQLGFYDADRFDATALTHANKARDDKQITPAQSPLQEAIVAIVEHTPGSIEQWQQANSEAAINEAIENYVTHTITKLQTLAEQYPAFENLAVMLESNAMMMQGVALDEDQQPLFHLWPKLLLQALNDTEHFAPLKQHLSNPQWMMPLEEDEITLLSTALYQNQETIKPTNINSNNAKALGVEEDNLLFEENPLIQTLLECKQNIQQVVEKWHNARSDEAIDNAIEDYAEKLSHLQVYAKERGYSALENMTVMLESNAMTQQGTALDTENKIRFNTWPQLLLDYLADRPSHKQALSQYFTSEQWLIALENDELVALESCLSAIIEGEESAEIMAQTKEPVASPPAKLILKKATDSTQTQTLSNTLAMVPLLAVKNVIDAHHDKIIEIVKHWANTTDEEALAQHIENYSEQIIQPIIDMAQKNELSAIEEIGLQITSNTMALHGQTLSTQQQQLFNEWPLKLATYLEEPTEKTYQQQLIALLADEHWPIPLDEGESNKLNSHLEKNMTHCGIDFATSQEQNKPKRNTDIFIPLQRQIDAIIKIAEATLNQWMKAKTDDEFENVINDYSENTIQPLKSAFENMDVNSFSEICMHVESNTMSLHGQPMTEESKELLERWPKLIHNYFSQPDNVTTLQLLLSHFQHPAWLIPLDDDEIIDLKNTISKDLQRFGITLPLVKTKAEILSQPSNKAETASTPRPSVTPIETIEEDDDGVPQVVKELFSVIKAELVESNDEMTNALTEWRNAKDNAANKEAISNYQSQVTRIDKVAEMLELSGLRMITQLVSSNLELHQGNLLDKQQALYRKWPTLVMDYLDKPQDFETCRALAGHFKITDWHVNINDEQVLLTNLVDIGIAGEEGSSRQTEATDADVDLSIPDDVMPELLESFLIEGPQHASTYLNIMNKLIAGDATLEDVNEARRTAHTLKGLANTVGIKGMANVTHHVEDILEYLMEKETMPTGQLATLLMDVADTQEMMFELLSGNGDGPTNTKEILQRVLDVAIRIDKGESLDDLEDKTKAKPKQVSAENKTHIEAPQVQMIRVAMPIVEKLQQLSEESAISLSQVQDRLQRSQNHLTQLEIQNQLLYERISELETLVNIQGVAANKRKQEASVDIVEQQTDDIAQKFKKLEANEEQSIGIFDTLEMDEYNELHDNVHRIVESVMDNQDIGNKASIDLTEIDINLLKQNYLNREIQDMLLDMRMQPVTTIESRLQRSVRQACQASDKHIDLKILGSDVLLDSQILNDLVDPLMHLLRNSVDHGIEPSEDRIKRGKAEKGTITLTLERVGNLINISIQDDGKGLDLLSIHTTAVEKGVISEETELSEKDMMRLIMMPGFSTKQEVTQLSGRGVGMDVVYSNVVNRLKGSMDIHSQTGKGCQFNLRIPLSLSFDQVLLLKSAEQTFAITGTNIDKLVFEGASRIQQGDDGWVYEEDNNDYGVRSLSKLLNYPEKIRLGDTDDKRSIIMLRAENTLFAIIVDELVGVREMVIKGSGKYLKNIPGIIGATILGNGEVAPVLDIGSLLRIKQDTSSVFQKVISPKQAAYILIVDDSFSVREYLSILLQDAGYRVKTARDGLDAVEIYNDETPQVMCVDMEMPRMNGLELTEHIRRENPHIPIMMITSRTAAKHRKQADLAGVSAYITKPYDENMMMGKLEDLISVNSE